MTAARTDFDLRALVVATLKSSITPDPGAIADAVFASIGERDQPAALQQTLRLFVRQVHSESRLSTQISEPAPGGGNSGHSSKVAGIRDAWQKSLRDAVHVGAGQWKYLGDCGAADLLACAEQRREMAARNRAKAAQYDILRTLVLDHGVDRVRDLPANILVATLGRAT